MERDIAKINIFNSIFESIKSTGFSGLNETLEIIEVDNSILCKFYDIDNSSDYIYLNSFKSVPSKYTFELAGISSDFGIEEQKKWFKSYISNPNKFVFYTLSLYISKLTMNSKLKNRLDTEFLSCISKSVDSTISDIDTNVENTYNESFNSEEFQDLIFISFSETIYNPEIEDTLNTKFDNSNSAFWNRFYDLYSSVFKKKYGESKIFNDSFFCNERIKKEKNDLGFEILENAMSTSKYPMYPVKFLPYFCMPSEYTAKITNTEYIKFRQEEFNLYNQLCSKYEIKPYRTKMI